MRDQNRTQLSPEEREVRRKANDERRREAAQLLRDFMTKVAALITAKGREKALASILTSSAASLKAIREHSATFQVAYLTASRGDKLPLVDSEVFVNIFHADRTDGGRKFELTLLRGAQQVTKETGSTLDFGWSKENVQRWFGRLSAEQKRQLGIGVVAASDGDDPFSQTVATMASRRTPAKMLFDWAFKPRRERTEAVSTAPAAIEDILDVAPAAAVATPVAEPQRIVDDFDVVDTVETDELETSSVVAAPAVIESIGETETSAIDEFEDEHLERALAAASALAIAVSTSDFAEDLEATGKPVARSIAERLRSGALTFEQARTKAATLGLI